MCPPLNVGFKCQSTEEKIIYSARLGYRPEPSRPGSVLRLDSAEIPVECHYER